MKYINQSDSQTTTNHFFDLPFDDIGRLQLVSVLANVLLHVSVTHGGGELRTAALSTHCSHTAVTADNAVTTDRVVVEASHQPTPLWFSPW